ncbi:MAG: hypothetical protein RRZ24_07650 [Clostridia bacterium]
MRTLSMGLGVLAGAAITLTIVNSMYPDVPKRMVRDGRRFARTTRRTFCDIGDMMTK